jgi:hypothetical protein
MGGNFTSSTRYAPVYQEKAKSTGKNVVKLRASSINKWAAPSMSKTPQKMNVGNLYQKSRSPSPGVDETIQIRVTKEMVRPPTSYD